MIENIGLRILVGEVLYRQGNEADLKLTILHEARNLVRPMFANLEGNAGVRSHEVTDNGRQEGRTNHRRNTKAQFAFFFIVGLVHLVF